jgi:hypothetical protein
MHSFRQSRSRILFDVFCALAISASCVVAWMQTYASALLAVAGVAALYGIVHAFDLAGRKPHPAVDQPASDAAKEPVFDFAGAQPAAASEQPQAAPETAKAVEEAQPAEPAAPKASRRPRAKAPRKSNARHASAPDEAKIAEIAPPAEIEAPWPIPQEEVAHLHIEPLFEPEPFVRMPRQAFGRKAG